MENLKIFCLLKSTQDPYQSIFLPHGDTVVVGRGHETKIRDKRCSRQQVAAVADYEKRAVSIQQLGPNPSRVGDKYLIRNSSAQLHSGDVLYLVVDEYPYEVHFSDDLAHVLPLLPKSLRASLEEVHKPLLAILSNNSNASAEAQRKSEDVPKSMLDDSSFWEMNNGFLSECPTDADEFAGSADEFNGASTCGHKKRADGKSMRGALAEETIAFVNLIPELNRKLLELESINARKSELNARDLKVLSEYRMIESRSMNCIKYGSVLKAIQSPQSSYSSVKQAEATRSDERPNYELPLMDVASTTTKSPSSSFYHFPTAELQMHEEVTPRSPGTRSPDFRSADFHLQNLDETKLSELILTESKVPDLRNLGSKTPDRQPSGVVLGCRPSHECGQFGPGEESTKTQESLADLFDSQSKIFVPLHDSTIVDSAPSDTLFKADDTDTDDANQQSASDTEDLHGCRVAESRHSAGEMAIEPSKEESNFRLNMSETFSQLDTQESSPNSDAMEGGFGLSCNHVQTPPDSSDDSDSVHMNTIRERLQLMREGLLPQFYPRRKPVKPSTSRPRSRPPTPQNPESKWELQAQDQLMVFTSKGVAPSKKIAAFDLDWTVIGTKTGKMCPSDTKDWRILFQDIPVIMKRLEKKGFKIVIFSNQKGLERGRSKTDDFCRKVQAVVKKLNVPVQAFVSTHSAGIFRKPAPGMWNYLRDKCNGGVAIALEQSFYVGDMAGRPPNWTPGRKKDFSAADRLFAVNIGIRFYTPEEFFLGESKAPFKLPSFDPRQIGPGLPLFEPATSHLILNVQEVVVLVGLPACGKSHFVRNYMEPHGYVQINRDEFASWQKCLASLATRLESGLSVVVDHCNPERETRRKFVECAKLYGVLSRCFHFHIRIEHAKHNNIFRDITVPDSKVVSDVAFSTYLQKYEEPSRLEGFVDILHVNFVPKFTNRRHETLYKMFLLDK